MMEEKPYSAQSKSELAKTLKESIHDYSRWVDKEIPINWGWIDEVEYMATARTEISEILEEMEKRGINPTKKEADEIMAADSKWLKQIREDMPIKIEYQFDKSEYPKEQWWWWLDEMDNKSIKSLIQ